MNDWEAEYSHIIKNYNSLPNLWTQGNFQTLNSLTEGETESPESTLQPIANTNDNDSPNFFSREPIYIYLNKHMLRKVEFWNILSEFL